LSVAIEINGRYLRNGDSSERGSYRFGNAEYISQTIINFQYAGKDGLAGTFLGNVNVDHMDTCAYTMH
jgi:hypothetical protein